MIGLATDTLLCLFDRSQPVLTSRVEALVSLAPPDGGCFLHPLVLAELAARLERVFELERPAVAEYLERILRAPEFTIPDADEVLLAIDQFKAGRASFPDCLLAALNLRHGCEVTVTFDRRSAESAGFTLLGG